MNTFLRKLLCGLLLLVSMFALVGGVLEVSLSETVAAKAVSVLVAACGLGGSALALWKGDFDIL